MKNEIKNAFLNSLVARACYADLMLLDSAVSIKDKISIDKRYQSQMTKSMAQYFVDHFDYVDSHIGDGSSADSGYDAVLLKNKDDGQYYLGNRGTETGSDIGKDLIYSDGADIVADGVAWDQALEMEAFYKSIIDRGLCVAINVSGHSLGGHLTTLFRLLHPEALLHGYTYNGAGVAVNFEDWLKDTDGIKQQISDRMINNGGSSSGSVTQFVDNLFSDLIADDWRSNVSDSLVTNYYVREGGNFVISAGTSVGERIAVDSDMSGAMDLDALFGHGMGNLSDALLVAYVLSTLDDTLDMPAINRMVESLSHKGTLDRNATIAYLGELLGYSVDTFRKDNDNEADLQQTAFDILSLTEERSGGGDLNARIVDLTALNRQQIADLAMAQNDNGLLMRYALDKLSSFALSDVTGNKPEALNRLLTEEDSGYRMVDASTGKGDLSRFWVISMEISGSDYGDTKESSPNGQPPCSRQRPGYQWATELLNDADLDDHHRRRVNVPRCTSLAKSFLQRVFASFLSASKKEVARKRRRRGAEAFSESMKACLPAQGWC